MSQKSSTDPRVKRTRRMLQESLWELLETKTLDKIQIKEIAAHADLSRQAFYSNFDSKEDLLFSSCDDIIMAMQGSAFLEADRTGNFDLEALLVAMFNHWKTHQKVLKWILQVENKDLFIDRLRVSVAAITEYWLVHEYPQPHPLHDYLVDFMTGGVYMLLRRWSEDRTTTSIEDISRLAYELSLGARFAVEQQSSSR